MLLYIIGDIMKKNGFTLLELIAAISIIAVISIIVLPDFLNMFNKSVKESMKITENNVLDAANLYIEDYCRNPISNDHLTYCRNNRTFYERDKMFICLGTLQDKNYLDEVTYKEETSCIGVITYTYRDYKYSDGKVYLLCGENGNYTYITEGGERFKTVAQNCG